MYKKIFLFLLIIFSLKFFDATIASKGVLKNICYGYMLLAILMSLPYFFKKSVGFILPVQLISVSIFISVFMAKYTWGQGFEYSSSTLPYLIWFVFFYLLYLKIPLKVIENIVLIYGILYILLFLFQFTHSGVVYFGVRDEFKEERGVVRVVFPGAGVFFLSCFMAINKVTSTKSNYKYLWLLYALLGVVIIVMQVTRQEIAVMLLFYLVHFLRNVTLPYKIATAVVFALAIFVFLNSQNKISKGLADQQKEDASYGSKYIRIQSAEYYLTQFTPNTISKIFGNGFFNDTSNYGKVMTSLQENYGYFITDIGLLEVYILFGVFALIGYILILIKSITIPLPSEYYYLKYYIWMIMLTALTSDFLISYYFIITTVLVLYCYQRVMEYQAQLTMLIDNPANNALIINL